MSLPKAYSCVSGYPTDIGMLFWISTQNRIYKGYVMKGSIIFVEASRTGAGEMTCAYARHQNLEVILLTGDALRYPHGLTAHCHRIIETDTTSIAAMISALEATE